jgi:hypothetical protein
MQTYSLTFPNSDPGAAVRPDRLAYLITAIACSAKVPVELVYISYILANGNVVSFVQPPHTATGVPTNCIPTLRGRMRELRELQIVATPSMNVAIYYLSPAPATPTDPVFQNYAAAIQGSAGSAPAPIAPLGNVSGAPAPVYPEKLNITAGGIVGIVLGVTAAAMLAAGAYMVYLNRRRKPISRSSVVSTETRWSNLPGKNGFVPEPRRH